MATEAKPKPTAGSPKNHQPRTASQPGQRGRGGANGAMASGRQRGAAELGATTRDTRPGGAGDGSGRSARGSASSPLRGVGGLDAPLELGDVEPAVARVYAQALDHPSRSACEARTLPSRSPRSSPVQLAYSDLRPPHALPLGRSRPGANPMWSETAAEPSVAAPSTVRLFQIGSTGSEHRYGVTRG